MESLIVVPDDVDRLRNELILRGDEAHHALKSLRLRPGDALLATDLEGICYECQLTGEQDKNALCSIQKVLPNFGEPSRDVLLIQAMIAQPARWEFLLEKATELGVSQIQPIITERTEQRHLRRDRSERILRAAVKQTKRSRLPTLLMPDDNELGSFEDALQSARQAGREIILLHDEAVEALGTASTSSIAIVVGPEGGFTDAELRVALDRGARLASLGSRRLRAETAAIAALAILSV
ncbi:MAG: RsmE family RNA methyltransferase [Bacteroidota bacterium]|nr:RsmE family RNA methyltransferase [Bacteroidota bacterium]MDP4233622.1 RsmE family RNA methyltransferase [Bacteroidota bacterium]MDP4243118.1 RsmE family RNA methyltransferase [Bacteroidota bacterium]MDP4288550.1 RsmE family RNA methyltransferase [Bacteroidota bacterium]